MGLGRTLLRPLKSRNLSPTESCNGKPMKRFHFISMTLPVFPMKASPAATEKVQRWFCSAGVLSGLLCENGTPPNSPGLKVSVAQPYLQPCCLIGAGATPRPPTDGHNLEPILAMRPLRKCLSLTTTLVAANLLLLGCSKKQAADESPQAAPEAAASAPAPANPSAPASAAPLPGNAFNPAIAAAQQAQKAKEYDKAAEGLIALQRKQLSDQQAAALQSQMRKLQSDLVGALASGDPKAKAAADKLRESSKH
jgi:hypothetical protein